MCEYKIKVNDCMLQIYVRGNIHSDTAVLFLHGGPGSGAKPLMSLSVFQSFEKDYCCVYFDQRGSGLSPFDLSKGITKESIVDDVVKVIEDTKKCYDYKQIFLWGGSFGGCVASLCILNIPHYFDGFILSSPAITFSRKQALDFFKRTQTMYQKKLSNNPYINDVIPEEVFSNEEMRNFVFSEMNLSNSLRHICAMSTWFYSYSFENLLNNKNVPILIVQGKDDPICDYKNIDDYVTKHQYSDLKYYLFDNCGHEVFTDKKREFVTIINKFIRRSVKC